MTTFLMYCCCCWYGCVTHLRWNRIFVIIIWMEKTWLKYSQQPTTKLDERWWRVIVEIPKHKFSCLLMLCIFHSFTTKHSSCSFAPFSMCLDAIDKNCHAMQFPFCFISKILISCTKLMSLGIPPHTHTHTAKHHWIHKGIGKFSP